MNIFPRAVILTALPLEFSAVVAHLNNQREERHPQGTVYIRGTFDEHSDPWDVLVAEIGAGNEGAAAEGERAIQFFAPTVAMFVGVAGGIKDVALGDVVASTKVYNYAYGKAREEFEPRPTLALTSYRLEQTAKAVARSGEWRRRIKHGASLEQQPTAIVGPIAAGSVVIASGQAVLYAFIRKQYGDAVAVEMEGHGHMLAVHLNAPVDGIVIRGISDLIEGKSSGGDTKWQPIAAQHAAALAFEIIARLDAPAPEKTGQERGSVTAGQNVTVHGSHNVVITEQSIGVDPRILESALKMNAGQQSVIRDLSNSLAAMSSSQVILPLPHVARVLIASEAERLLHSLRAQLDLLEFPTASNIVREIRRLLADSQQHLPRELVADLWAAVADAHIQMARQGLEANESPDLAEADEAMENAKHVLGQ
jgi:nucleoside phosphorylase